MACYQFEGMRPVIHPSAFVHPDAVLIGDVIIGAGAYVAPGACLRGDYGRLIVEAGANIQDGCVMHGYAGVDTIAGAGSSIGHGAILHGCRIGRGSLVGMRAVVMDGAQIGAESIVAAMSFVPAGFTAEARQLVKGIPARCSRPVTDQELHWNSLNSQEYRDLAQRCRAALTPCQPLDEIPADRAYLRGTTDVKPLHAMRPSDASGQL